MSSHLQIRKGTFHLRMENSDWVPVLWVGT